MKKYTVQELIGALGWNTAKIRTLMKIAGIKKLNKAIINGRSKEYFVWSQVEKLLKVAGWVYLKDCGVWVPKYVEKE